MNKNIVKIFILAQILTLSSNTFANQTVQGLPPILDYIPNCTYQVIEKLMVKTDTRNPKSESIVNELLTKLQNKAAEIGADALILVDKKIEIKKAYTRAQNGKRHYTYRIRYVAESIKQCKDKNLTDRKLARFNHQGQRTVAMAGATLKLEKKFTFINKSKTSRPKITDNEVSLSNGVYGVKLGEEYESVIDKFGVPSVQLSLLEDELIIGYGRGHWFHFQANKLVKIQSSNDFLSQSIINQVPLLEFFDDASWKINNTVARKMLLDDVKSALNVDRGLNDKNQLTFNRDDGIMMLNFIHSINHHNKEESYVLKGFILQTDNYKKGNIQPFNQQLKQFNTISQAYKNLALEEDIDLPEFKNSLGDPVGRIILSKSLTLEIYNPNLLVTLKNNELASIHLTDGVFSNKLNIIPVSNNWYLDHFNNGESLDQTRMFFPENAFEMHSKVELQSDKYTLYLFFDENSEANALYEAEIKLWF